MVAHNFWKWPTNVWLYFEAHSTRGSPCLLVVTSVEQHVSTEVRGVSPSREKSLMGEFWINKDPRPQIPEYPLLLKCLCMFATAIFLWCLSWCEWVWGDSHRLECSVFNSWICSGLLGLFAYGLLWRWFLPKLYCILDNNVTLNRVLETKKIKKEVSHS